MTYAAIVRKPIGRRPMQRETRAEEDKIDTGTVQLTDLGLSEVKKLRLTGILKPRGQRDWVFDGHLGATIVQPCVVTLTPVTTRIEEDVARHYVESWVEPEEGEAEMPEDDTLEPLPDVIDLLALASEALALAIPDYPRAEGVELGEAFFVEPGVEAMSDEAAKPFAGLAALKEKLSKGS